MRKDLVLIAVIVAIIALMILPLNQAMIDVLLALNISLSVVLLLVAVYLKNPSDFSTFPSIILLGTAFRLALSVGTTRLILADADGGQIIQSFGDFLVDGSIAIGFVIFLVITVVQFLVVTKGAERVAEVGARFALDAMPGKQMSIDAEARAGDLDADQARAARLRLNESSQFFGAMDGAMKFVKGDSIAGLIIICINLLGGIAVGVTVHGMGFGEAVSTFSLLTVGDGLVAQLPAILMALCAGIVVTRVEKTDTDNLGVEIFDELARDARVPSIAAVIVFLVGFIPGFPTLVFACLSAALFALGVSLRRRALARETEHAASEISSAEDNLPVSGRLVLLVGTKLAQSINEELVLKKIKTDFAAFCETSGVNFTRPGFIVSEKIDPRACAIALDNVPLFKCKIPERHIFVEDASQVADICHSELALTSAVLSGAWVPADHAPDLAERQITHESVEQVLSDLACGFYQHNIADLFTIPVFEKLHEALREAEPEAMARIDEDVSETALYKILKMLVEEGVPITPFGLFTNALHYWVAVSDKPTSQILAECMRGSMKRQICERISRSQDVLGLAMISPDIEALARTTISNAEGSLPDEVVASTFLPRQERRTFVKNLQPLVTLQRSGNKQIALVISADLRRQMVNFLSLHGVHLPVLSPHEVSREIPCLPIRLVTLSEPAAVRFPEDEQQDDDVVYFDTYDPEPAQAPRQAGPPRRAGAGQPGRGRPQPSLRA